MHRWLYWLFLLTSSARSQEAPPESIEAIELAFQTDATRMTVPVTIAGAGPYRFIVDTGAERTVLSRELAARLGLPRGRDLRVTAMTGTTRVGSVIVDALVVGAPGATLPRPSGRIESPALSAADMGALGILGIDMLQGSSISIDFDTSTMTVAPSVKRRSAAPASDEIVVRARSVFGQLVVTDARYRGQKVRVVIDTGSVVSMANAALRQRMERARERPRAIELTSVTGGKLQVGYTQIAEVAFGDATFANLPVAFADAAPFRRFGLEKRPAMLLGMDALRLFRRVDIDFANREVRLRVPRGLRPGGGRLR